MSDKPITNQRDFFLLLFFLINAAFWLVNSVLTFIRLGSGNIFTWVMSILMIINSLIFLYFGLTIHKSSSLAAILALCFLFVNIFLTMTDQLGFFDLITLIINMVLFLMLIMQWFRPKANPST